MARPKLNLDPEIIEKLAKIQCTYSEIAAVLGCEERTLKRRFVTLIKKGWQEGRASLRRMQWKSADDGNATMQIWLGKQLLDQSDQGRLDITSDGQAINFTFNIVKPNSK